MDKYINAPISDEDAKSLHSGDYVYITGIIYTARDAAHKRMAEALSAGQPLPIDMKNNIIYYMGPSPAREGRPEAIRELEVENLPVIVVIDSEGNNLYETAIKEYSRV